MKYPTTIHLTADDVDAIIRTHFGMHKRGVQPGEYIKFKVNKKEFAQGSPTYEFGGADVTNPGDKSELNIPSVRD
jgi:hypothetical protein